jgi:hypothetical protein
MSDVFRSLERLMAMDDGVWRRHANPWSGWTRVTVLPLLVLAIWSRVWIGWWALLLVLLVCVWTWLNPRVFPEPRNLDAWMTRGVLGERVFLEHRDEVAAEHVRIAKALSWLSLPGALVMIWGLWALGAVVGVGGVRHDPRPFAEAVVHRPHGLGASRLGELGAGGSGI